MNKTRIWGGMLPSGKLNNPLPLDVRVFPTTRHLVHISTLFCMSIHELFDGYLQLRWSPLGRRKVGSHLTFWRPDGHWLSPSRLRDEVLSPLQYAAKQKICTAPPPPSPSSSLPLPLSLPVRKRPSLKLTPLSEINPMPKKVGS